MAASKDGLQNALEFTKFIVTLDSALIAFVTGATFLAHVGSAWEKAAAILTLLALAASLCSGIAVYMRAATMFGAEQYDLSDRYIAIPGIANVVCFALGAIGVGCLAVFELILKPAGA